MRRLAFVVSAIILLDIAFFAAIIPLLPSYTHDLGLSKTAAGVLTGTYAAGNLVAALPSGWLAGRIGAKATMLIGVGGLAVSSLVFGLGNDIVVLDTARFAQGVAGSASWAGGFAWIVERAPADRRGEYIGNLLGAAIAGALFGPVLGAAAKAVGPEPVFGGVALVAALLGILCMRESSEPGRGVDIGRVFRSLGLRPIQAGIWLVAIPALMSGVVNVLVPLRLDVLGASAFVIGAAYLTAAGIEAALSPVLGRYSDRHGRLVPIRAGLLGAAVLLVLLPLPRSAAVLVPLFILAPVVGAAFWAPAMTYLSDTVDKVGVPQGFAFAFTNIAWSAGQVVGTGGGGALADATADWVSYALVSIVCLAAFFLVSRAPPPAAAAT